MEDGRLQDQNLSLGDIFSLTAFSVQVEQVEIAAGVKSFYRGSWQSSAFFFSKSLEC